MHLPCIVVQESAAGQAPCPLPTCRADFTPAWTFCSIEATLTAGTGWIGTTFRAMRRMPGPSSRFTRVSELHRAHAVPRLTLTKRRGALGSEETARDLPGELHACMREEKCQFIGCLPMGASYGTPFPNPLERMPLTPEGPA